ncbi:unnamed protein product [Mycena citricolor]|uniref:Uncharacterized protein n=1 Tax=Mycena citricolor TaxID=2018698 RepID=A0AAD2JYY1_9AGAR|nr:unnamed protein product [Mycena citricolor]
MVHRVDERRDAEDVGEEDELLPDVGALLPGLRQEKERRPFGGGGFSQPITRAELLVPHAHPLLGRDRSLAHEVVQVLYLAFYGHSLHPDQRRRPEPRPRTRFVMTNFIRGSPPLSFIASTFCVMFSADMSRFCGSLDTSIVCCCARRAARIAGSVVGADMVDEAGRQALWMCEFGCAGA